MSETPPRDWAEVRSRLRARLPGLITSTVLAYVVFSAIAFSRGASWTHALIDGLIAVAILTGVIVVSVSGLVLLMVKTRPTDQGS